MVQMVKSPRKNNKTNSNNSNSKSSSSSEGVEAASSSASTSTLNSTTAATTMPPSKTKSKRRQGRKNTSAPSKNEPSSSSSSFQITPEFDWIATQDTKTVFGPPPPPPTNSNNHTSSSTGNPSSNSSPNNSNNNNPTSKTTTKTFTTPKGVPYSVITNLTDAVNVNVNLTNDNHTSTTTSTTTTTNLPINMNMNMSNTNTNATVNSVTSSMAATAAAAFGHVDIMSMAQSEMMNFGLSAATMMAAAEKHSSGSGANVGNVVIGTTTTTNSSGKSSSTSSSVSIHQAKDALQKYVDGVSAATAAAASSSSRKSSTSSSGNGNGNGNGNGGNKQDNSASSGGGNVGPGITSQPCSDADMKALMSMFVEIMGMSSSLDSNGNATSNDNNNNSSGSNCNNNNNSNNSNGACNIDPAALNAARSISEQMTKIQMKTNAMSGNTGTSSSSKKSSNNSHNHKSGNNNNNSSPNSSPFPVVSMMFGSGGNTNTTTTNSKNKNMPNVIPPPPSGWPPGAAAAAAAALAAASNGASSVTLPIGGGSISLPLGMVASHNAFAAASAAASSSSNGGSGGGGTTNTSGENSSSHSHNKQQGPPEWMREACNFIKHQETDYDDAASEISAVNGSDNDCENDHDDYDDHHRMNTRRNGSNNNSNSSAGAGNSSSALGGKPPPQDRSTGESMIDTLLRQSSNPDRIPTSSSSPFSAKINQERMESDISDAAAAELLREEEEAALKLQEEAEKIRRAAKKREKKNRKKEKARREATIKAAQAAQKKREKTIHSWRSRVASACLGGEVHKIDALISDNPFKETARQQQQQIDPEILEELGGNHLSFEEEVNRNMAWLLPSCVAKSRDVKPKERESRTKLGVFVMRMAFHVVFTPRQDRRSALHTACIVGDFSFVKLVTERVVKDEHKKNLDCLCDDMGWSPLHYAAVSGWSDIVELLLGSGCDIRAHTDPHLTCFLSNDNGVTAKELLELIFADNYAKNLEFNRESMEDIINNNAMDRATYKQSIGSLISRLNDVETNGYTPLQETKIDCTDEKIENDSQDNRAKSKKYSKSEMEESKSSKKKKKKKKKSQQVTNDDAEESSVTASISSMAKPEPELDLVSMLLAMGFTEMQINSAVDACGGTDRATADDLIEWILGGGESSNRNETDQSAGGTHTNRETGRELNSSRATGIEQKQKRAAMHAEKQAEEAAKREVEVKAAAERLAAKREEQRRIRREWNNREQLRQQEEAKAKLSEEVERKRRIEIEKAKITAQRVAKERAAANVAVIYQDPNATVQPLIHGNTILPAANNLNVGATPLFPGTSFQGGNAQTLPTESQYYPDMQSPNLSYNQPVMQQAASRSFPQSTPNFRAASISNSDSNLSTPDVNASRMKAKKVSPVNLEVNGYEFPVLGANKPPSPNRRHKSKNKDSPNVGDNRKGGKSKMKKKKSESPSKDKQPVEIGSQTPIIVPGQGLNDQSVAVQSVAVQGEPYESNPLGEIRATAKAFVPTHFTPSASPQPPPGLVNAPKSVPPGLVPSSTSSNPLLPPNTASGPSILSNTASSMLQGNPATGTSMLSNGTSSILPGNPVPFDGSAPNSSIAQRYDNSMNTNPISMPSPPLSTNSSVVGLPTSEDNLSLAFTSPAKADGLLGSTVLGGLSGSSIVGSSLGMLESQTAAPSLSGSSIWGGASTTAAPTTIPGFYFGDASGIQNSRDDTQKHDSATNQSSMWGTGGVPSMNGGGGSIW